MGNWGSAGSGGVTLIELMVLLAVVAIVQALAAPAMSRFSDSIRLTTATNALLSSIHLARSEAVKRNDRVVVCRSASGQQCAGSGGWIQGWIVFHDANNNAQLDSGEARLAWEQALSDRVRVSGNSSIATYVSYTGTGATRFTWGGFQAGTFTLCAVSDSAVEARLLVISSAGRPRTKRETVDQCP